MQKVHQIHPEVFFAPWFEELWHVNRPSNQEELDNVSKIVTFPEQARSARILKIHNHKRENQ